MSKNHDVLPDTSDVLGSELRTQLACCRSDWESVCRTLDPERDHMDPMDVRDKIRTLQGAHIGLVVRSKPYVLISRLEGDRAVLIGYLRMKTEAGDWHGVSDAANDIREIEAELRGLRKE